MDFVSFHYFVDELKKRKDDVSPLLEAFSKVNSEMERITYFQRTIKSYSWCFLDFL